MSLRVYAISARPAGPRGTGIHGERLRSVRVGTIYAIVGAAGTAAAPTDGNLRRHDRILLALWERSPALLPAQFGSVVRDRRELEFVLAERQDALRRRLALVRSRAQMTVRMLDAGPRSRTRPRARSGAQYLRSRADEARRAREVPQFEPLRPAVDRWVRAERVEKRGRVATIYHLIPRRVVERYRRALAAAAAAAGVHLLVSGPRPAWAFAEDSG